MDQLAARRIGLTVNTTYEEVQRLCREDPNLARLRQRFQVERNPMPQHEDQPPLQDEEQDDTVLMQLTASARAQQNARAARRAITTFMYEEAMSWGLTTADFDEELGRQDWLELCTPFVQ